MLKDTSWSITSRPVYQTIATYQSHENPSSHSRIFLPRNHRRHHPPKAVEGGSELVFQGFSKVWAENRCHIAEKLHLAFLLRLVATHFQALGKNEHQRSQGPPEVWPAPRTLPRKALGWHHWLEIENDPRFNKTHLMFNHVTTKCIHTIIIDHLYTSGA